jgi:hypothetical protein
MKKLTITISILFALQLFFLVAVKAQKNEKYQVCGTLFYSPPHCGGAAIRTEDISKDQPFAGRKIIIIEGNVNSERCKKVAEIITNEKGEFSIDLPSGKYGLIIEDWKQVKLFKPQEQEDKWTAWDLDCLQKEYAKPDLLIKVSQQQINNLVYTVYGHCSWSFPCKTYTGPLPP